MTFRDYMRHGARNSDMAAITSTALKAMGVNEANGKAWAYRLKQQEEAGDHLMTIQSRLWREALGVRVE